MEKIKGKITSWLESEKGKDILVVIIVILVGLVSFELGRLSKDSAEGLKIEYMPPGKAETTFSSNMGTNQGLPEASVISSQTQSSIQKSFFASTKGKKYYSLGCAAGKSIKMENRIYFDSRGEAEKAGYALSSSCN